MNTTTTKMNRNLPPESQVEGIIVKILGQMISHPEAIDISDNAVGRLHNYRLKVRREDMPKMIGDKGANINALGALADLVGRRHGLKVTVRGLEPDLGGAAQKLSFSGRTAWRNEEIASLFREAIGQCLRHPVQVTIHDGDDFISSMEVEYDQRENQELIAMLQKIIEPLATAVGKNNGRHMATIFAVAQEEVHAGFTGNGDLWKDTGPAIKKLQ